MFTKYCVLNKRGKFGITVLVHYTDIFVLRHFILTHPVVAQILSFHSFYDTVYM